jgi:hypothetical protein
MIELPAYLERGEIARLIPVVADTSRENRAASILLAALTSVKDFRKALLSSVGQRIGDRTRIDCYTEVVFKKCPPESKTRSDGLIRLRVGKRAWSALVEAKIGGAQLDAEQLKGYVQIAKMNGVDAVITLSNQFSALPTHHPVPFSKKSLSGISLYHWSWMYVLTQATLLLAEDEFASPEQRYILSEMVRYFKHDSVGVSSFDRMNPEWKGVVLKVQSGGGLNRASTEVANTVTSWHQEQRDLCLLMSRELGRQVRLRLKRAHAHNPTARIKDDSENLVKKARLEFEMEVPDAAASINVTADLRTRHVFCAMRLAAPADKKKTSARVRWLTRQLEKTDPENVFIKAIWPTKARDTMAPLAEVRADPSVLQTDNQALAPKQLEVAMGRDLAGKFSGTKTFIEQLEAVVPCFYEQVGQHLRAWVPPPPKPKERVSPELGAVVPEAPESRAS